MVSLPYRGEPFSTKVYIIGCRTDNDLGIQGLSCKLKTGNSWKASAVFHGKVQRESGPVP
jgi:hypothetical protein